MKTNQSYTTQRRQAAAHADKVCAELSEKKWDEVFDIELSRIIDLAKKRAERLRAGNVTPRVNRKYAGDCGLDYVAVKPNFYHPNFGNQ